MREDITVHNTRRYWLWLLSSIPIEQGAFAKGKVV